MVSFQFNDIAIILFDFYSLLFSKFARFEYFSESFKPTRFTDFRSIMVYHRRFIR